MILVGTIVYGDYQISSAPCATKDDAYELIKNSFRGVENQTGTYRDPKTGEWYVISHPVEK